MGAINHCFNNKLQTDPPPCTVIVDDSVKYVYCEIMLHHIMSGVKIAFGHLVHFSQ